MEFGGSVIGTEEAWALSELPATLVVIGAGASGTEIASAYARLGTQVTLFEGLDRVLPTEDADISKARRARVQEAGHRGQDARQTFYDRPYVARRADWVVIAAGRGPDVEALGLDAAGVELDRARPDQGRRRAAHQRPKDLRDRRPRPRAGAGAQGLRRGHHRRRGRRRAPDAPDLATSTSRARRSARPTSARFGLTEQQAQRRRATTSSSARSSTARSARAPSTATAPA